MIYDAIKVSQKTKALGHLGVQFAKCLGLKVACVDSRQAPLELVGKLRLAPVRKKQFCVGLTECVFAG